MDTSCNDSSLQHSPHSMLHNPQHNHTDTHIHWFTRFSSTLNGLWSIANAAIVLYLCTFGCIDISCAITNLSNNVSGLTPKTYANWIVLCVYLVQLATFGRCGLVYHFPTVTNCCNHLGFLCLWLFLFTLLLTGLLLFIFFFLLFLLTVLLLYDSRALSSSCWFGWRCFGRCLYEETDITTYKTFYWHLELVIYFLKPITYPWAAAGWGCLGSSFGYRLCCRRRRLYCSSGPGWFNFWWSGRCSGGALRSCTRWRGTQGVFQVSWKWGGARACRGPFRRPSCLNQHVKRSHNKHFREIRN